MWKQFEIYPFAFPFTEAGNQSNKLTIFSFLCRLTRLKAQGEMVELAEGTGLENRRGCKSSAGSNPALSAIIRTTETIRFVVLFFHLFWPQDIAETPDFFVGVC